MKFFLLPLFLLSRVNVTGCMLSRTQVFWFVLSFSLILISFLFYSRYSEIVSALPLNAFIEDLITTITGIVIFLILRAFYVSDIFTLLLIHRYNISF